ncbi:MAG: YARHG domain-containing protein, partial [Tannerellaceae bacterium]|nr:YARHG domain-containing protein [Tannerellaceae bacterium]
MVSNSDLQKWQSATDGINESGQNDLTGEEWSALVALNKCLSSGNFESVESRRSLRLLSGNLRLHDNNRILQMHLRNFIALCDKYGGVANTGNSSGESKPQKKSNGFLRIVVIAALAGGCWVYKNWKEQKPEEQSIAATVATNPGVIIDDVRLDKENIDNTNIQATTTTVPSRSSSSSLQLSNRLLTEADLRSLSEAQLRILHNEIYARHGYICESKGVQEYFSQQSWYHPRSKDVTRLLTATEKKNVELIRKLEASASSGDPNNNGISQSPSVQATTTTAPSHSPDLQPSNHLLAENDLRGLSKAQLRILRNEIYARHGYIFQSKDLQEYFSQQSWYQPRSRDVTHLLTATEKKNVEFIKIYETSASSGDKNSNGASRQIRSGQIQSPPIVNVYARGWNAMIRLPEAWNGTSVLANGFIFIPFEDKKLQNKYNVHPGGRSPKDGHIYFD